KFVSRNTLQGVEGRFTKKHFRSLHSQVVIFLRMNTNGNILGEGFLHDAQMGSLLVFSLKLFDFLPAQQCKHAKQSVAVFVTLVEPELIELVRRGTGWIQPDIAAFT